jgi:hypothetical protein
MGEGRGTIDPHDGKPADEDEAEDERDHQDA